MLSKDEGFQWDIFIKQDLNLHDILNTIPRIMINF